MGKPVRTPNGRYRISVQDRALGIPRQARTFDTAAQCKKWEKHLRAGHFAHAMGGQPQRTFGEALLRYLTEITPTKGHPRHDHSNARALQWPYRDSDTGAWRNLADAPLPHTPDWLHGWLADQRLVQRRSYLAGAIYHLRADSTGQAQWYLQPPDSPRRLVADPVLLRRLTAPRRRAQLGPFSSTTLRTRQILVSHILRQAWRRWRWLDTDIAGRILLERAAPPREHFLLDDAAARVVSHAAAYGGPHFADLVRAYLLIGWRRSNIIYLDWQHLAWPAGDQPGYIWADRPNVKTKRPLVHPMGPQILALLRQRQTVALGPYVFHSGQGDPWGDFRKRWRSVLRLAGVPDDTRIHDLRHTWASERLRAGASDAELQALGGWSDPRIVRRYAHARTQDIAHRAR